MVAQHHDDTAFVFCELRSALARAQAEVAEYEKEKEEEIVAVTKQNRQELRKARAELCALQERLDVQAEVLEKEREIAFLDRSRAELQPTIDRLRREAAIGGESEEALRTAMRRFSRFGLAFEGTADGALGLTFTQIDKSEPNRAFRASVVVNERDSYEMTSTYPELSSDTVRRLLDDLNRTNDFSTFVRQLRSLFQALTTTISDDENVVSH